MAKINQRLLDAIHDKTALSIAQVYARIGHVARRGFLPRHLAAIRVAAETGIAINKYATAEELAELRNAGAVSGSPGQSVGGSAARSRRVGRSNGTGNGHKGTPNQVFVVHGRDRLAREDMFGFLRSIGVKPIEWNSAIAMTKKATHYVGEILDTAFFHARAVVVLLTPDDLARVRDDLLLPDDPAFERRQMGQARPNVLFEAGMAFSSHPDRTVLVQLGRIRPFSDAAGRHIVHMTGSPEKRRELATKLQNSGCDVDLTGSDWLTQGDFSDPELRILSPTLKRRRHAKQVR
jgi:predicted nucleotide-binding protein